MSIGQYSFIGADGFGCYKYTMLFRMAIELEGAKLCAAKSNNVHRVSLASLRKGIENYRCAGGSYLEYVDTDLAALTEIVTPKYQTLAYYGLDPKMLQAWVIKQGLSGIDRIVPIGKTADFQLAWDGYDLILSLSRIVAAV